MSLELRGNIGMESGRMHYDCSLCDISAVDYVLALPDVRRVDVDARMPDDSDDELLLRPLTNAGRRALDQVADLQTQAIGILTAVGVIVSTGVSVRFSGYSVCQALNALTMLHMLFVDTKAQALAAVIGGSNASFMPDTLGKLDTLLSICVETLHNPMLLVPAEEV